MCGKRFLTRFILLMALGMSLAGFGSHNTGAAEKLKLGTPLKATPHYDVIISAAEQKGFWSQNGLDVEWVPFRGATDMHQATAARSIDVGYADIIGIMQAVARGVPELVVADTGTRIYFSIWVLPEGRIKEPKDLKGATIGSSRFGGAAYAFGYVMVKNLGLEKEVKFVAIGGVAERIAALKTGATDAFVQTFPPVANLVAKGELKELMGVKGQLPKDWTDLVLLARPEIAEKSPGVVKRFVKAFFQSTNFVQDNRPWSVEKLKTELNFSDQAANLVYEELRFSRDGKINPKAFASVLEFITEYGILPKEKAPDIGRFYTTRFTD